MIAGLLVTSENKPESDFTEYILNLGDSKLFENVTVLKQKTNPTLAGSNLKFKLVMEVL
ncbi:MAG: hypothetical protein GY857_06435 [Desulfobacula sp.]|nr:hypothetical protein [Desulfobacula sp.]